MQKCQDSDSLLRGFVKFGDFNPDIRSRSSISLFFLLLLSPLMEQLLILFYGSSLNMAFGTMSSYLYQKEANDKYKKFKTFHEKNTQYSNAQLLFVTLCLFMVLLFEKKVSPWKLNFCNTTEEGEVISIFLNLKPKIQSE